VVIYLQSPLNLVKGINKKELTTYSAAEGEGIVALDQKGCALHLNKTAEEILGWQLPELQDKDFFIQLQFSLQNIAALGGTPCPAVQSISCSHLNTNAKIINKNGDNLIINFMLGPLFDEGRMVGKVFVFSEANTRSADEDEQSQGLVESAASVVVSLNAEGGIQYNNEQAQWLYGGDVSLEHLLPENLVDLLLHHPHQLDQQTLLKCAWVEAEQREICIAWSVAVLRDDDGALSGAICIGTDFTDHFQDIKHSQQEHLVAQKVFEHISDGVISVNHHGEVEYLNPVAEHLTGCHLNDAVGQPLKEVYHVTDEGRDEVREDIVSRCLRQRACVEAQGNGVLLSRGGWEFIIQETAIPVHGREGEIIGAVVVFNDVSELRGMERWMEYESTHDELTGLINRRSFQMQMQVLLESAHKDNRQHALLYMDLDQFNVVNDSFGHGAGDALLKEVALVLKSHLSEDDHLARLGGDEFGLVLEDCPLSMAEKIAKRLCGAIREFRFVWDDKPFEVSVSIGLVPITCKWRDVAELQKVVDSACFIAKERGRNRVHVYQAEDSALQQREGEMQWIQRITQALENDYFQLYCQSIVPLDASSHGMPSIDRWVIRNAFLILGERRKRSDSMGTFAINLSGQSLDDEGFLRFVIDELDKSALPPEMICFEITESAAASKPILAQRFMSIVRGVGCRFALDDFGKGVSSFAYLKHMDIDYLKIDGMFVRNLAEDKIDLAMVESINHIGHVKGVQTIAEFVESQEILERLMEMGVDHVQGYQLGRPRPMRSLFTGPSHQKPTLQ
jgi:diguanylate cyclase (GGDEF)-like protein/PAS domain S-box-containing protein